MTTMIAQVPATEIATVGPDPAAAPPARRSRTHPVGARFPRAAVVTTAAMSVEPDAARYGVGARFPRRSAAELAERIPVMTVPAASGRPVGARFPRPE